MATFQPWPKIARLNREVIITEKIDGTNSAINIILADVDDDLGQPVAEVGAYRLYAQSRKRLITPEGDNFGFAAWVRDNAQTLLEDLGQGIHYGEWWGSGIQRNYGLDHRVFSLFNTERWADVEFQTPNLRAVPVLYRGMFDTWDIGGAIEDLQDDGSHASPGFTNPEGIIVYHVASGTPFKVTIEGDDQPKGLIA